MLRLVLILVSTCLTLAQTPLAPGLTEGLLLEAGSTRIYTFNASSGSIAIDLSLCNGAAHSILQDPLGMVVLEHHLGLRSKTEPTSAVSLDFGESDLMFKRNGTASGVWGLTLTAEAVEDSVLNVVVHTDLNLFGVPSLPVDGLEVVNTTSSSLCILLPPVTSLAVDNTEFVVYLERLDKDALPHAQQEVTPRRSVCSMEGLYHNQPEYFMLVRTTPWLSPF